MILSIVPSLYWFGGETFQKWHRLMVRFTRACSCLGRQITPIIGLFLLLGMSLDAEAQNRQLAPDAFTIADVSVDVTAKTAAEARKKALSEGEKRAFEALLKRLTLRIDHLRLPVIDDKEIASYVQDFAVKNEKNSPVRYLADLTYRFKPRDIRLLLRDSGIEFAETVSKTMLVLPVYQVAGAVALWDDPNPWREAWVESVEKNKVPGLVPLIFGQGDLKDIATISAELVVRGDKQRIAAITKRYGVTTTLVVLGTLSSTSKGLPVLRVTTSRYGENENKRAISTNIVGRSGEGVDALLKRAAIEVDARIEDQWKADNLLQFERAGVIAVTLPINSLAEWVEAKRRLERVAVIENAELVLFSRTEVRLNINFIGEAEQLKLALAQADMALTEEEGSWILRLQQQVESRTR